MAPRVPDLDALNSPDSRAYSSKCTLLAQVSCSRSRSSLRFRFGAMVQLQLIVRTWT
jgi:hypothetical protein